MEFDQVKRRDLIMLLAMALVTPALMAVAFVTVHAASGIVPWSRFVEAATQFWIGDAIGIASYLGSSDQFGPRTAATAASISGADGCLWDAAAAFHTSVTASAAGSKAPPVRAR